MEGKHSDEAATDALVDLLKDIFIAQLALSGVPQQGIRKIVGCSITRVNNIAKHLKKAKHGE